MLALRASDHDMPPLASLPEVLARWRHGREMRTQPFGVVGSAAPIDIVAAGSASKDLFATRFLSRFRRSCDVSGEPCSIAVDVSLPLVDSNFHNAESRSRAISVHDIRPFLAWTVRGHDGDMLRRLATYVESVDRDVSGLWHVMRSCGVPSVMQDAPLIDAVGTGIHLAFVEPIVKVHPGSLPDPFGEVGTPLLGEKTYVAH